MHVMYLSNHVYEDPKSTDNDDNAVKNLDLPTNVDNITKTGDVTCGIYLNTIRLKDVIVLDGCPCNFSVASIIGSLTKRNAPSVVDP